MKLTQNLLCSMFIAATVATPVWAALGGDATSVQNDLAKMKGALRISASPQGYEVHEITTSYGTVVREYLNPAGKVFALGWDGPFNPDLRQVLGTYYTQYTQAPASAHQDRAHLRIAQPGLVVQISGRVRAFVGRAWAPDLLPANFSTDDIK
jgi:hypothetical protein